MKEIEIIEHLKSIDNRKVNQALYLLLNNQDFRDTAKRKCKMYNTGQGNFEALFEEAYADGVIDFFERIDSYNPDLSAIKSSIVRFTRINMFTAFRTEQRITGRQKTYAATSSKPLNPEKILLEKERHDIGLGMLQQLGASCWSLIILRSNRFSFEEIAQQIGKRSADAAKQAYYACSKKLNHLLAARPDFLESL